MAAKAALAFLLLATAAAYSSQRVPIDARRSHVVAAERRRRFNAAAALIGVAAAAPPASNAITWKDDREDVNAVFMDKYPKAILIESGIALLVLALAKAGIGPLGEKFREEGD